MNDLRDRADRVFSLFIRVSYADFQGYVSCYTCGERMPWQEAQNGHWLRRGFGATRYSEDNCRPQCRACNEQRGGMPEAFEEALRTDIGDERVDALIALAATGRPADEGEVITKYTLILREKYATVV